MIKQYIYIYKVEAADMSSILQHFKNTKRYIISMVYTLKTFVKESITTENFE